VQRVPKPPAETLLALAWLDVDQDREFAEGTDGLVRSRHQFRV
jgi:hypothetical protein